ncbi:MAG TPA: TVP38/TMEM64 family protein [Thermoanaerobacter sp.]|uniref:TVP38/TMEM64 family protein n=1 Tax=Thermoanaerobacter sp. A7A TaxID=1350366 RepID=UPI000400E8A6|nr:TVP38/TMEM64 family protein [Thermoanaerobacter sp. A7A]HHY79785.1 TVP38/TMEM64 family protein [Thermoanaerobacter sp.]
MKMHKTYVINLFLVVIFAITLVVVMATFGRNFVLLIDNPYEFRQWIHSFGKFSVIVFIGVQILQVVIFAIPGEVVQIAGGYLFGTFLGTLYSVIGITIGSLICFLIARVLGYNFVRSIVSEENLKKFDYIINNPKGETILFLLFFIPGMPKDALSYIAGITPVKFYNFFIITLFARLPGIFFSAYIGANLGNKNYFMAGIVAIIAVLLFLIGVYKKDVIMEKLKKL